MLGVILCPTILIMRFMQKSSGKFAKTLRVATSTGLLTAMVLAVATVGFLRTTNIANAAVPTMTAVASDQDFNGTIDQIVITFSELVSLVDGGAGDGFTSLVLGNGCTIANSNYANASTLTLTLTGLTGCSAGNTALTPSVTYTSVANCATAFSICDAALANQMANSTTTNATDGADPVLTTVVFGSSGGRNRLSLTYTEAITASNGASTTTKGDTTIAGTVAGFGTFATAGNTTVATTKNTIGGSGTSTITVDLADQTGAFIVGTSTTAPSGDFTSGSSAAVVDAVGRQVHAATVVTPSTSVAWDLTKPTITSVTLADLVGNNGRVDRATVVFNTAVRDSNITNGEALLGGGSNTGTFTTGTANDATTVFNLTSDAALAVDTSATAAQFTYTPVTTSITDLAGNLLDTATDGAIANADIVEEDDASPILVSVVLATVSNRNRMTFTYSEAMTITNGASTTSKGDVTTAGTVAGFGAFAVPGNVSVGTTLNTVGGNGSAVITLDLADQTGGNFSSASTTEPSGLFTPVASASLTDGARMVNFSATQTASSTGWDLTKPTITSVTLADVSGNNGKVDQATIVFNSAMRDSNITNGEALLGGGSNTGTFTTGTANDATTVFNLTADTLAVDTSATAAQFTYSPVATRITDLVGNRLDTTTDGSIVDGDITETDGASPILVSAVLATVSSRNRMTFTYSEAMTITNGASTTTKGDMTTAGTVAGFGSFATVGNAAVATTKNTVAGNGTTIITIDFADQAGGNFTSVSTTEPSGVFTPVGSAVLVDAATPTPLTVNTSAAPTASSTTWDLTKPTITSVTLADNDVDGRVDRATIVFNSSVRDSNITNGEALLGGGSNTGTFATGTANDATTVFSLTADTLSQDTSASAAQFTYTPVTTLITDLVGNLLDTATDGSIANADIVEGDGAAPVILSASYLDTNGNGTVDAVRYVTSTDTGLVCTAYSGTAGMTITTAGTVTIAKNASDSCATNGTSTFTITLATVGATNLTGGATAPVLNYNQPGNGLEDGAGNDVPTSGSLTVTDGAKPVPITATFYDATSNDGKLDKVIVLYSETLAAAANASGTWALSSAANFSTIVEGSVLCNSGLAAATACNYNFTTATVKTNVGDLTLAYTAGTDVQDASANTAVSVSLTSTASTGSPAFTDAAAPVVASSTPANNAAGVLRTSTMSMVFSEPVASLTHSISGGVTLTNGSLSSETVAITGTKISGSNTFTIATAPDSTGNAFNRFLETGTSAISFTVASSSSSSSGGGGGSTARTYAINISSPVATAAYEVGDEVPVRWETSGTGTIAAVNLAYSTDGGVTYTTIATGTNNDGVYTWTAPDVTEQSVTLRAQGTDLVTVLATDTSDAFSITGTEDSSDTSSDESDDSSDESSDAEDTDTSATSTTLLPEGTFFKGESWSTVYYVGTDGTRRPFLDSQTFFTYADNFESVINTSDEYLSNYMIGAPMMPKAGSVLIKVQSVSKVYVLGADNELRWITSEDVAKELFGNAWADYVIDVPATAWTRFTVGADIAASNEVTVDRDSMETRNALNSK